MKAFWQASYALCCLATPFPRHYNRVEATFWKSSPTQVGSGEITRKLGVIIVIYCYCLSVWIETLGFPDHDWCVVLLEKMVLRDLVMGGGGCAVPGTSSSANPLGGLAESLFGSASKTQVFCSLFHFTFKLTQILLALMLVHLNSYVD